MKIVISVPSERTKECPTRDDFRVLCMRLILTEMISQGILKQDTETFPFPVEFSLGPDGNGGYKVTADFEVQ